MNYIKRNSEKIQQSFLFFSFAILGVFALYFKLIHPDYKIGVLSSIFILSFIPVSRKVHSKKWSLYSLGFRLDNIKASYKLYLFATILGSVALYFYSEIYHLKHGGSTDTFLFYSVLGCIAQEFLYRVFLWKLGEEIFGKGDLNVFINIIIFSGMHVIYDGFWNNHLWLLMVLAGTLFTLLYKGKHQNFYLVTSAHIILNIVAVYFGIFH